MACVITLPHAAHAVQGIQHYTCLCMFIATSFELDYMHRLNAKKTKETRVLKMFSAKTSIM